MLARTIIALVSSPWYGLLVTLIVIPLMIAFGVVAGLVGSGSLVMAAILMLSSVLFQAVVYAQSARYAGSFTGLQSIVDQPEFFAAVGRCLAVTIIVGILSAAVTWAFFLVFFQLGGADEWWWMDPQQLAPAIQAAMNSPARAEQIFSFENMNLDSLLFILQVITMFFVTIIAIFAVPRAVGLGAGYERGYSMGLILARFFVAFPFLGLMSGLVAAGVMVLVQKLAGIVIENAGLTAGILLFLEVVIFTNMMFSFEAAILRSAREHEGDEAAWAAAAERTDTTDFRAIRESWNER